VQNPLCIFDTEIVVNMVLSFKLKMSVLPKINNKPQTVTDNKCNIYVTVSAIIIANVILVISC